VGLALKTSKTLEKPADNMTPQCPKKFKWDIRYTFLSDSFPYYTGLTARTLNIRPKSLV
jgi:hypothetical protein